MLNLCNTLLVDLVIEMMCFEMKFLLGDSYVLPYKGDHLTTHEAHESDEVIKNKFGLDRRTPNFLSTPIYR